MLRKECAYKNPRSNSKTATPQGRLWSGSDARLTNTGNFEKADTFLISETLAEGWCFLLLRLG